MEKPETQLEMFSPILLMDYVRLMTAAYYVSEGENKEKQCFKISPENYQKMMEYPLKAPLIGLNLNYLPEQGVLEVMANEDFVHLYENKIMREVALTFVTNYGKRYLQYIEAI